MSNPLRNEITDQIGRILARNSQIDSKQQELRHLIAEIAEMAMKSEDCYKILLQARNTMQLFKVQHRIVTIHPSSKL
jgi:hypothetical protein